MKKPTLELNRAAKPQDSTEYERDSGLTIKGHGKETILTPEELVQAFYLDENNRQEDGSYYFSQGSVTVNLIQDDHTWRGSVITTRANNNKIPSSPDQDRTVSFGFIFQKAEDNKLRLVQAFSKHRKKELDNQHVNNPEMLAFALEKAGDEVRMVKDPEWWVNLLRNYDEKFAQNYIETFLDGRDPTISHSEPTIYA